MKFAVAISSPPKSDLVSIGGVEVSVGAVVGTGIAIADEQARSNANSATKKFCHESLLQYGLIFCCYHETYSQISPNRYGVHQ